MSFLEELKKIEDLIAKLIDAADKLTGSLQQDPSEKENDAIVLNKFRQAEFLAHNLAYTLNFALKTTNVLDEDGKSREYLVKKIETDNAGLVSFICYSNKTNNLRVHLTFRGTHNASSAVRDLEFAREGGPGFPTLKRNIDTILQSLANVIKIKQPAKDEKLILNIAGHSLGGADVQNFTYFFLTAISDTGSKFHEIFKKIGTINIMHANSAGVTSEVAISCEALLQKIKNIRPDFNINQYIIHFGGDLVQQLGHSTIFSTAEYPLVNTYMLKGDTGQEGLFAEAITTEGIGSIKKGFLGTYTAHTNLALATTIPDANAKDVKFKIFHNADPKEALAIARDLNYKIMQKAQILFGTVETLGELSGTVKDIGSRVYSAWNNWTNRKPKA